MKKTILFLVITLLTLYSAVHSQPIQKSDSVPTFEKARYLKGDLGKALLKNTMIQRPKIIFPMDALFGDPVGDVVFSFIITKEGKLEKLVLISPMIKGLSPMVLNAINQLDNNWAPAKENGNLVDKSYTIVFRYRPVKTSEEFKATDFKIEAEEYVKNKKYDKALRSYNKAIVDNPFEYRLFESRAKVKELLGDIAGSKQDQKASLNLYNDVMIVSSLYTSYPAPVVESK
jgi:tetratricopeptide (TPR) repeat protein